MADTFGLQIFNDSGQLVLDYNSRTAQIANVFSFYGSTPNTSVDAYGHISGPYASFNVPFSQNSNDDLWFAIVSEGISDYTVATGYSTIYAQRNTSDFTIFYRAYNPNKYTYIYYGYN